MRLRSRSGSIVLGVVGATYALAALGLLGWMVPRIGSFAGLMDYVAFLGLLVAAAIGVWFIVVAAESLHVVIHLPHFRRTQPGGPTGARLH